MDQNTIWAVAQHFLQDCMCAQWRLWSACTFAQSDRSCRCGLEGTLGHCYPLCTLRRLRSDYMDVQADLSLCWVHMQCCASTEEVTFEQAFSKRAWSKEIWNTLFDLIMAHIPISAQSSNSIDFRLQPVYFMSTSLRIKAYVVVDAIQIDP